jgi:hypothetical protein
MTQSRSDQNLRRARKFLTRFGFFVTALALAAALCLQRQDIPKVAADRLPINGTPYLAALPDVDADSKLLVVHGPFKAHLDATHTALEPRDRRVEGGGDDLGTEPGPPCDVPAKCPGGGSEGGLAVTNAISPKILNPFTWDDGIGASDPQIAAGPNCLLVSAYKKFAYLDKTDGRFLPLKELSVPIVQPGGKVVQTNPPIGILPPTPRTGIFFTDDLFAPMLDDINAHLNLTTAEQTACKSANFDCHINRFSETRIVYDNYRHRFWLVSLAIADGINAQAPALQAARRGKLAVAVSITSDPRDGWNLYWWDAIPNDGHWHQSESSLQHAADYPSLGISPKYVIEENAAGLYHAGSSTVTIVEAEPLARGQNPNQLKAFQFWNFKAPNGNTVTSGIQPAVHHGDVPADFAAVFASTYSEGDQCYLLIYFFNDALGRFNRVQVPIKRFFGPRDAPQPASAAVPDPFKFQLTNTGTRVMKAAFENGRVYATFADCRSFKGAADCTSAVRLVRVNTSSNAVEIDQSIGDKFRNEPDSVGPIFFGMPAVEVNRNGDVALVYMRAGKHVFPQAAYSMLLRGDTAISSGRVLNEGTAAAGGENNECAQARKDCQNSGGQACQKMNDACNQSARDLDVAGIAVDPVDDSIWIADGYRDADRYQIAVGHVFGRVAAQPKKVDSP